MISHPRRAMTMLEIVIASTMLTVVLTSVTLLLRTGREAWNAHCADYTRLQSAHGLLRHLVRHARQAESVQALSGSGDASGSLSLRMPSGDTWVWEHNGATQRVNFGVTAATDLLAEDIASFEVVGYQADGVAPAADVADVQVLLVTATVELDRDTGGTRSIRSWIWVRAW